MGLEAKQNEGYCHCNTHTHPHACMHAYTHTVTETSTHTFLYTLAEIPLTHPHTHTYTHTVTQKHTPHTHILWLKCPPPHPPNPLWLKRHPPTHTHSYAATQTSPTYPHTCTPHTLACHTPPTPPPPPKKQQPPLLFSAKCLIAAMTRVTLPSLFKVSLHFFYISCKDVFLFAVSLWQHYCTVSMTCTWILSALQFYRHHHHCYALAHMHIFTFTIQWTFSLDQWQTY